MSPALSIEQSVEFNNGCNAEASKTIEEAVSKLMLARRAASEKISGALDDVSQKLHQTTKILVEERARRSSAELVAEKMTAELESLQRRYEALHAGLVKVLTQKFPDESALSIENRMDAFLLASNSGAEIGEQPDFVKPEASKFIDLIDDSLLKE